MTKESDSKDLFDFELPEGLNDDLGGDWESAFQAEDFMLTPEDEAEVFFEKEKGSDVDDFDLAALLDSADSQAKQTAPSTSASEDVEQGKKRSVFTFFLLTVLLPILTRPVVWFQDRPLYQKILFPSLTVAGIIVVCATLFFRSTTQELAEKQPSSPVPSFETKALSEQQPQPALVVVSPQPPPQKAESLPQSTEKNRKKWPMRNFFIAAQSRDGAEALLVKIDLSLVLLLDPATSIPEEKRAFVRDTIFQFFANRPPEELRRYSLARGEMVRNLESWLQKEWPNNPIVSLMFDRYQILN